MNLLDLCDLFGIKSNNINSNKLDFTKKEDVEKLETLVNEYKDLAKDNTWASEFLNKITGKSIEDILDNFVNDAKKKYNEAHPVKPVIRKVVDKTETKEPARPSENTPEEMQKQIVKLVADYMNEKILPNAKLTDKQTSSVSDCLFEFACWIYNR